MVVQFQFSHDFAVMDSNTGQQRYINEFVSFNLATTLQSWTEYLVELECGAYSGFQFSHDFAVMDSLTSNRT